MKFFLEIKNRFLLILFTWLYLISLNYYYKEVLYFFIINDAINDNLNFYFVYTNITELFLVYIKLIQFLSFQIINFYLMFNTLTFFKPASYKKEFMFIERSLYIYIISWLINFWLIVALIFPNIWAFFLSYNNFIFLNLFHLEIKISSYFEFFISVYNFFLIYFYIIMIIGVVLFNNFKIAKSLIKYRKCIYYLILIFLTPLDFIIQFFILVLFIVVLEFLFFFILIKIVFLKIRKSKIR